MPLAAQARNQALPMTKGDRAPNFVLPDNQGKFSMFYERTRGRPVVLLFLPPLRGRCAPPALLALETARDRFETGGIDLFAITIASQDSISALSSAYHLWADPEGKISGTYLSQTGLGTPRSLSGDGAAAIMLDANQRLLRAGIFSAGDLAAAILDCYDGIHQPGSDPSVRTSTAPVLIMPRLLDGRLRTDLMRRWTDGGHSEGTVGSVVEGKEIDRVYHSKKKRLDHVIEDPAMNRQLATLLGRRIAPEVHKAFGFEGFRFDRFLVVCYDAAREDRFRPHRDNISKGTEDRRFALTLNLNASDYEGGELIFPEYGPDGYKPGDGGGVIFSCSLIHEALPVTRGRRFALLTFLRQTTAA